VNIAIVGAGNVGKALGMVFTRAGNTVTYAATSPEHATSAAEAVGGSAARGVADAARDADIVVIAVPFATAAREVVAELAPVASGRIVIDTTNPLVRDYSRLDTFGANSAAEWFASALPGAKVVKAFNTLFASIQANPEAHGLTLDSMYATDDADARKTLAALIRSIGFRPVYVGPLARARELEALAFLNIRLQVEAQGSWNTAINLVAPPEAATRA
jgi:hypothetical protein